MYDACSWVADTFHAQRSLPGENSNAVETGETIMARKQTNRPDYPGPSRRQREPRLSDRRNRKMAESVHAYVRGNAVQFYAWLSGLHVGALPEGPAIWICGDCHVGNLGPVADEQGRVAVQIRDFDQTVIGNPAHDLVRLGLSLATAARSANLPGITTARMMEALFDGYERAFDPRRSEEIRKAQRPSAVRVAMKEALHRSWRQLARQNIAGTAPRIPVGKRFWPLTNRETAQIRVMFEADDGAALASVMRQARPNTVHLITIFGVMR